MYRHIAVIIITVFLSLRAVAGPKEVYATCLADAKRLPKDIAYQTRYLYDPNPNLKTLFILSGHCNSLSKEVEFSRPRIIAPGIYAIILYDYAWSPERWEKLIFIEPWFHQTIDEYWPGGYQNGTYYQKGNYQTIVPLQSLDPIQAKQLYDYTYSKVPVVRADWFLLQTARQIDIYGKEKNGTGYYDFLEVKNRADFEKLAAVDKKTSIKLGYELLAAIQPGKSGIAQLDRGIEWYMGYGDSHYWRTLDTSSNLNNKIVANLERGAFVHQAEEAFISLPNGLFASGLFTADAKDKTKDGTLQSSAPDFIGGNTSPLRRGNDLRIHVGIACIQCHGGSSFLLNIDDWARRNLKLPNQLESQDYKKLLELKRQYLSNLNTKLEKGRFRYRVAILECTGMEPGDYAKAYSEYYYSYLLGEWTIERIALESGVKVSTLRLALSKFFDKNFRPADPKEYALLLTERKRLADLDSLLGPDPDWLPVSYIEQHFGDIQRLLCVYGGE